MLDRSVRAAGIAVFLICLLGPGAALASVKCQCNNGSISYAMDADFDDDDAAAACDDACSMSGGGRVWSVDSDAESDDGDVTIRRGDRVHDKPEAERR
jgi:hypothetical protein